MTDFTLMYDTISTDNSSTTPLAPSAVFTGTWEDCSKWANTTVAVKSDANGTFSIQYSPDLTNIDSTLTSYYRATSINPPHKYVNTRKYCRVVFTNTSSGTQVYFRLQTSFSNTAGQLNAPIDGVLSRNYDSISVRPTDFKSEVALGLRQGFSTWNMFGYNNDVDIGTEVIASFGGTFTPLRITTTVTIACDSVNDTLLGTGAQKIVIYGVDEAYDEQTEVVDLNGTTNVITSSFWLGINRVVVYKAGTLLANDGNIVITATTGASIQARMNAGEGTTQQLIYFIPKNYKALMSSLLLNAGKIAGGTSPKIVFKAWTFSEISDCKYEVFRYNLDTSVENHIDINTSEPFEVDGYACIWFEATTDQNNTSINGRFSLVLVKDNNAD